MLNYITGKIVEISPAHAVVECNGIGYSMNISLHTYSKINRQTNCKLLTHLVINKMDYSPTLIGFADEQERSLFRNLISVSGVGVSTARIILSSLNPVEIQQAIVSGNFGLLKSVKGIGEKTAQRIVIDLKNKIEKEGVTASDSLSPEHNTLRSEALSVLLALGFGKNTAEKAIDLIMRRDGTGKPVEHLVKEAMRIM